DQSDARTAPQQLVAHPGPIAIDGQHERRPVIVLVVPTVHVSAAREQQIEKGGASRLDGHMQRLRAAAPEWMRTDGVDHFRRGIENVADVVDQASADELEELLDGL